MGLLILAQFIPVLVRADTAGKTIIPKNLTTYAASDFQAYKKSGFTSPVWDPFVQEGFEAMDRRDIPNTLDFLRKAVNYGCQSPIVYFKLGVAYEFNGTYYTAIQYYELAKEQFRKSDSNHRYARELDENIGRALFMMGQSSRALPLLEKKAATTQNPWVLQILAQDALGKKDTAKAAFFYDKLLHLKDHGMTAAEITEIYLNLARSFAQQNDEINSKKYYEQTLLHDPTNAEAKSHTAPSLIPPTGVDDETTQKVMEIFNNH